MSPFTCRTANARAACAALLMCCLHYAQAASTLPDLIIRNNIKDGDVPTATLIQIIAAATPVSRDEQELILGLKLDVLERYLATADGADKPGALSLAASAVDKARQLYEGDAAKLIPVLRLAARVNLFCQEPAHAIALLTEARRIADIVYGVNDPATRFVVQDLGRAYEAKGEPAQAGQLKQRSGYLAKLAPAATRGISVLASTPQPQADKPFQLVPVFYQTMRKKTGDDDPQAFFGTQRAEASSYGISHVSVPRAREIGSIPHASIVKLDFSNDPNRHVVLKEVSLFDGRSGFVRAVKDRLNASGRKETLVYIHGFNQSFQDGMETAAMLAVDLEIDGGVVAYSWPSKKSVLRYVADMDESIAVANKTALKELLADITTAVGARSVYVIAHSMGNRLLLDALQQLPAAGEKRPFDSIVFASPDVESKEFETLVGTSNAQANRMTLYTAAGDIPLGLSELIRTGLFNAEKLRRAGDRDGGVKTQPYLDVVDASKAQSDWLGHSNFAQLAKDDLRALLWLRAPATKRCVLQAQAVGWRYDPTENCSAAAFGMATLYYRRLQDAAQAAVRLDSDGGPLAKQANAILKSMLPSK